MERKPVGFTANFYSPNEAKDVEFEDVKKEPAQIPNLYAMALVGALKEFVENERHNIALTFSLARLEAKLKAASLLHSEDKKRFIQFKWSDLMTTY